MKLNDKKCQNTKPTDKIQKLFDGNGLYLEIKPSGKKFWRYKFRYLDKEKNLTLGKYPETTLAEAREKHRVAHKQVDNGENPLEIKQQNIREKRINHANTFESIAKEWLEHKMSESSERYCQTILTRLEINLFPTIGKLPIKSVTPAILLDALKQIESRGVYETTKRLRQYASQIFKYAIASGVADNDPSYHIQGALKTKKVEHQKSLPLSELPELLQKLERNDARLYPQTRLALKLMILTFTRKKELSHAKWDEISFEDKMWIIPAERMKMKKDHIVPLSKQSFALFKELKELNGDWEYVFPSPHKPRQPMHEDSILRALYRLGYKGAATIHGFRALAMTTIMEKLGYRYEVPDRQLAHSKGSSVKAAYDRAEFLQERTKMMQDWADYLDEVIK